jgi:hypothetical protein
MRNDNRKSSHTERAIPWDAAIKCFCAAKQPLAGLALARFFFSRFPMKAEKVEMKMDLSAWRAVIYHEAGASETRKNHCKGWERCGITIALADLSSHRVQASLLTQITDRKWRCSSPFFFCSATDVVNGGTRKTFFHNSTMTQVIST